MRHIETYFVYVYTLYLAGLKHRHPDGNLNDAAAHTMALATVGVPLLILIFLGALYIDRSLEIDSLRVVNLVLAGGVFLVISKHMDRVVTRQQERIMEGVSAIKEGSKFGPILSYLKGVSLLSFQLIVVFIAMGFWA